MIPEELKNEDSGYWRYIRYFFYGWVFFATLLGLSLEISGLLEMLRLNEEEELITNMIWDGDWMLLIFIPVIPALATIPLFALAVKKKIAARLKNYLEHLLFPLYFFPIKLVSYSLFYLIRFIFGFIVSVLKIIWDFIAFPFRSLKNFFKSAFIFILVIYVAVSFWVNVDYLSTHYGYYKKFFNCTAAYGVNEKIRISVVRVVGGYSEGSGFFIQPNQIVTNFHVIAGEPSPKIIFPDGQFITPEKAIGDQEMDLAIIFTEKEYPDMVMDIVSSVSNEIYENEALFATGYAMGTSLLGDATQLRGNAIDVKRMSGNDVEYIRTNIGLVEGMSGGPLTDLCGTVIGINTMGIGGTSLFIPVFDDLADTNNFTDEDIEKIEVDPSASPEEAVKAFYIYLKARKMKEGFNLLSEEYLKNTNFEEWSSRFDNVIDVNVIKSEKYKNTKDTVFVKFATQSWVGGEVAVHYYEGTWTMVKEDGVYKIQKGKILEVDNAGNDWFDE